MAGIGEDLAGAARTEEPTPEGIDEAVDLVKVFLEGMQETFGLSSEDVILAGFSQGATLAIHVGQKLEKPVGALVLLAGRFMATHTFRGQPSALESTKTIMVHGKFDPICPFWAADYLQQTLEATGTPVVWLPYRGGHRPSGWGPKVHRAFARALRS